MFTKTTNENNIKKHHLWVEYPTDLCSCDEEVPWQYISYAMQVEDHVGQVAGVFRYAVFRREQRRLLADANSPWRSTPNRADLLDLVGRNLFIRCCSVPLASTHSNLYLAVARQTHTSSSTCFMPFTCFNMHALCIICIWLLNCISAPVTSPWRRAPGHANV